MGALRSRASQQKRRERLRLFDLDEPDRTPAWPVGLRIASKTPAEIAVAIAAELIWVRNTLGGAESRLQTLANQRARAERLPAPAARARPTWA